MKELERYYEDINPEFTAEELTERVISKAEMPKKRFSSKFIGIAAAAAAVMTLGVTAAASGLGYFDVFSNLFGEKAENLTHNILEEAEVIRNDTEKMDFELVAAAADKHRVLVVVDVTAKNGFKLGENHIGDARADFWKNFDINISGGGGMSLVEGDENSARVMIWRTASEDITGREIVLTLGEYQVPEMPDYETDKQWQVRFTAYGESLDYEIDDVKISVSPISVWFGSENKSVGSEWLPITIITENDTVTIGSGGKSRQTHADGSYEEQLIYRINDPIDPESVIAIEVQGTRYDLK
ncbi:MAG: hypothetical protein IKK53_00455 [Ruminiclostridium sp.]|nr:hypothetical protein [Ruminiclostridium sp.]